MLIVAIVYLITAALFVEAMREAPQIQDMRD